MRIEKRKNRLRDGNVRQILVSTLDRIFNGVGEKFQLIHKMREFRRGDLCEFELPLRELVQDLFRNGRCDARGGVVYKFCNLRHDGISLEKSPRQ